MLRKFNVLLKGIDDLPYFIGMDVFASEEEQAKTMALDKAKLEMLDIIDIEEIGLAEDQIIEGKGVGKVYGKCYYEPEETERK